VKLHRRPYRMNLRAESAHATRQRILDATVQLLGERLTADVRLEEIAARARASVQTVLRLYGSRQALLERAGEIVAGRVGEQRGRARPGDVPGAVAALFDRYEELGDLVVRRLAEELREGARDAALEIGRRSHRAWVERQFQPQLARHPGARRERVVHALVAACDVYTWKLLRRDLGLAREQAESTVRRMVTGSLGG